jgi:hypothetical protein
MCDMFISKISHSLAAKVGQEDKRAEVLRRRATSAAGAADRPRTDPESSHYL